MPGIYNRLPLKIGKFPIRRRCSQSSPPWYRAYSTCHIRSFSGRPRLRLGPLELRGSFYRDTFSTIANFSSDAKHQSPTDFSHLQSPSIQDAHEFFHLMDSRPGCLLTAFSGNKANDNSNGSLEKYNVDWTGHYRGFASIVVLPQSTEEVSRILRYCNERLIGIVPQGGNTGLVGGSIPISSREIVLSLEKMNNIEIDDEDGNTDASSILRAEAGCILQDLQDHAAKNNCLVPVDLGAKGTCQIGGNVSTNAGGVYYYRYGGLHANVLGLEVVIPTGDVLNLGYSPKSHLKDNTGYDLKHLFIGGEGTLGVVTKVALRCQPLPVSRGAIWLSCSSMQDIVKVLTIARTKHLSEILAAFEFMDGAVLELVRNTHPAIRFPIDSSPSDNDEEQYSILLETHGSNSEHDREKLESFLECLFEDDLVIDGAMAQNLGQLESFWNVRELCNPASAATGFCYKYDISLAASEFGTFISDVQVLLKDISQTSSFDQNLLCVNWGHIIDGNLHCNIVSPGIFERDNDLAKLIDEVILEEVIKRKGSISAEHGLGQNKHKYLPQVKDRPTLETMFGIKNLFDPHRIMNPGKYLPPSMKSQSD